MYIDDIMVYSENPEDRETLVREVLQQLLKNKFVVNAEKCEWHMSEITFVGHHVSYGQTHMPNNKIQKFKLWQNGLFPSPKSNCAGFLVSQVGANDISKVMLT